MSMKMDEVCLAEGKFDECGDPTQEMQHIPLDELGW